MSAIVTVCVLTYNPDWTRLRNTLRSIICQKNIDFDIVIADDGSKVDCFDKVDSYFREKGFRSYKFIKNIENQGTVKNAVSALQHTNAKYVKMISPGDFLYDENVLAEFVAFAEKNPADAYFGNAVYYSVDEKNEIIIHEDKRNPRDLEPWIERDYRKIWRNYMYRMDYILGASVFCERQYLYDCLFLLKDVVKYTEDMFLMYGITNKDNILYVNKNIVFYEYGVGISTNANSWSIVNVDICNFKEWLYQNCKISIFTFLLGKTKNRLLSSVLRLFLDPLSLLDRFGQKQNVSHKRCEGNERVQIDINSLKQIIG